MYLSHFLPPPYSLACYSLTYAFLVNLPFCIRFTASRSKQNTSSWPFETHYHNPESLSGPGKWLRSSWASSLVSTREVHSYQKIICILSGSSQIIRQSAQTLSFVPLEDKNTPIHNQLQALGDLCNKAFPPRSRNKLRDHQVTPQILCLWSHCSNKVL